MAARVGIWLAIAVGGLGGGLAALFGTGAGHAPAPVSADTPSLRAASAPVTREPAADPSPTADLPPPTLPTLSAAASTASADASAASPVPIASQSAPINAAPPAAELLPLPTTKEALLRAEMHCDQRQAAACIVAARSYEASDLVAPNPEKSVKYRRIALTAWINQCDHNSASACATLATMYRAGSGVPQSERNAAALVARARELCRFNDSPACHELPPID